MLISTKRTCCIHRQSLPPLHHLREHCHSSIPVGTLGYAEIIWIKPYTDLRVLQTSKNKASIRAGGNAVQRRVGSTWRKPIRQDASVSVVADNIYQRNSHHANQISLHPASAIGPWLRKSLRLGSNRTDRVGVRIGTIVRRRRNGALVLIEVKTVRTTTIV